MSEKRLNHGDGPPHGKILSQRKQSRDDERPDAVTEAIRNSQGRQYRIAYFDVERFILLVSEVMIGAAVAVIAAVSGSRDTSGGVNNVVGYYVRDVVAGVVVVGPFRSDGCAGKGTDVTVHHITTPITASMKAMT